MLSKRGEVLGEHLDNDTTEESKFITTEPVQQSVRHWQFQCRPRRSMVEKVRSQMLFWCVFCNCAGSTCGGCRWIVSIATALVLMTTATLYLILRHAGRTEAMLHEVEQARDAIKESDKCKSEFVSFLSHELR